MADNVVEVLLRARADMSQVTGSISDLQKQFQKLELPKDVSGNLEKSFAKLNPLLKEYQKQLNKQSFSPKDVKNLEILKGKIESIYSEILGETKKVNGQEIKLKADVTQIEKAKKSVTDYKNELQKAMQTISSKISGKNIGYELDKILNVKGVGRTNFSSLIGQAKNFLNTQQFQEYNNVIDRMRDKMLSLTTTKYSFAESLGVKDAEQHIEQAERKIQSFFKNIRLNDSNVASINNLRQQLAAAEAELERLNFSSVSNGSKAFDDAKSRVEQLKAALSQVAQSAEPAAASMSRMQSEIQSLQSSTQYFFGLRNMFMLLKRGIREALQTVKELDAAMTETAVVTNFSVGDMWEKLPEYTANANALGASVQDMYEATTLYYQQGLNAQQAMSIASETMKMARIGGLEAAEATDMMTAALRGFNMELNETSAQRINDVYSNLAAKTASNTEELGTAMQRTASIAHSAGMSFEGTAAFLAQAIETTREPAENLGTAMKTIVARFQELKKNPLEVTEVEGEEVSYNKVDAALQTIGVDLKDVNGQFRSLDQVFLDISQKWNSLTQTQQRYIATTAAGSRQQSRFIAMMSNYDRTMQLMEYANDSSGASNEQFGKTLESLEAKLNKLQNAWKEFLMGITDSNLFKGMVDGLTKTLNIVNSVIDKLSLGNGAIKSFLSLFVAFKTLSVGGRLANNFIGGIGGFLTGAGFMGGYRQAAGKYNAGSKGLDTTMAGRISTPIVMKLDQVIAAIKGQKVPGTTKSSTNDFKKSLSDFYTLGTKNSSYKTMGDVQSIFNNLSDKHGSALMTSAPGTTSILKRSTKDWFGQIAGQFKVDAQSQKIGEQLIDNIYRGMEKGQISPKEGASLLGKPELWGDYFGTEVAQSFSNTFKKAKQIFRQQQREQKNIRKEQAAAARKQAWVEAGGDPYASEAIKKMQLKNNKELATRYTSAYKKIRKSPKKLEEQPILPQSSPEKIGNEIGKLGSKFTSAGFSIQMFGQQLSMLSPALAGVGNMISTVGAGVTTFGMTFSTVGKSITKIGSLIATIGTGPALLGIAALSAALGALIYDIKKVQNIKKAAKEVVDNFTEINKSTTDNINNLEQWRSEMAILSKGVDQNGNNISLDTSEYDRYRELVNNIAEINPSIVKGYNAQGDAIIDNNNALAETLELQKKIRKEATEKYTSNTSLNKLIAARNENEDLYVSKRGDRFRRTTETRNDLVAELKGDINWELLAQQLGFDFSKASESLLTQNYQLIEKAINSQLGDNMSTKISEKLDAFVEAQEDKIAANEDIYKALSTYAEQQNYTGIVPEELLDSYQQALRDEASTATSASIAKRFAKQQASKMKALGGETSEAGKLFKIITDAQKQFNYDFDQDSYNKQIDEVVPKLKALSEEYRSSADETKKAFADTIDNMIAKAQTYTTTGGESLVRSFDSTKNAIDAMSSAYDEFKKALEGGSLEKATESLKSIYDEMYSGTNAKWEGNTTYWTGAKNFISDELFKSGDFDKADKIIKGILPTLEDTEEGYKAAFDYITDLSKDLQGSEWENVLKPNDKGGFDIEDLTTEAMEGIAKFKDLNPDILRTLFKKVSRVAKDVDTWDPELVKQSYIGDERAYFKEGENGEQGTVYIKEGEFESDLLESDIAPSEWDDIKNKAEKNGIDLLPDKLIDEKTKKLGKGVKKEMEQAGITSENYMPELIKRGYSEEDVIGYGEVVTGKSKETLQEEYNAEVLSLEDPVSDIDNGVNQAVSLLDSIYTVIGGGDLGEGTARDSDFLGSQLYDETFGKKGETTEIEQIHAGKSREGDDLTPENYQDAKEFANEQISASMDYLHEVRQGLEKATQNGDKEQIAKYTEDVKKAEEAYNYRVEAANNLTKAWAEKSGKWQGFTDTPEHYYNQRYGLVEGDPLLQLIGGGLQKVLPEGNSWFGAFGTKTDIDSAEIPDDVGARVGEILTEKTKKVFDKINPAQVIKDSLVEATESIDMPADTDLEGAQTDGSNISKVVNDITTGLTVANDAFMKADKAALAMEVVNFDTIGKAITNVGQRLKAWHDKINKVESEADNSPKKSVPTINKGIGAVTQVAQEAVQKTQTKVTVDTSDGEAKINNLKTLVNDTVSAINEGATFTIRVPGLPKLKQAAKAAQTISKNAGTQTIGVSTGEVDTSSVDSATSAIKDTSVDIQVGANTDTAYNKVNTLIGYIGRQSASVTVTPTLKYTRVSASAGGGTATVSLSLAALGMNNNISYPSLPTFGSLAKGTKSHYGQIGPRNKGGLTLTGEKGYEIAWIPSENRSMIVGANGPQMLNLPKDAVVWTHEQSKKIIKQKAIPAGSHGDKGKEVQDASISNPWGTRQTEKKVIKPKPKKTTTPTTVTKDVKDAAKSVKKVSVFWQNIGLKVEATQHRADLNQKVYEKYLAKLKATLTKTGTEGQGNKFIQNTTQLRKYGKSELKQAQKNLNKLGTNKKINKTISWTKNNKTKKEKIDINKYIKKIGENEYIIDSKKLNKAKTNKGKKIDKKGKKAIRDAAEKEIKERLSKVTSAEDLINKSTDSLDEFKQKLYDTFFAWETELTKIWNITQKISATSGKIERLDSFNSLLEAQLNSGEISSENYIKDSLKLFKQRLQQQDNLIKQRQEAISESKKAVNEAIKKSEVNKNYKQVSSLIKASDNLKEAKSEKKNLEKQLKSAKSKKKKQSIQKKINKQNKIIKNSKETLKEGGYSTKGLSETEYAGLKEYKKNLENENKIKNAAQKYTKITQYKDGTVSIDFDYDALMEDKNKGIITSDLAEGIDKYVKDIIDSNNQLNEAYNNLANDLTSLYEDLEELDKAQVDASMELLNIYEDSEQKKLDKLKSLSNALDKAFKNLIDEVKKKLDERRKQEDNIKTERELSQKQQRLTTLRADTAGGHAIEIAQLEKEIAEAQQNYQRTLEDQLLEKIEQQGDEASKQRERQIELQEQLLEVTNNAAMIDMWMAELTNENTTEARRNEIKGLMREAYREANNYNEVTGLKKGEIDKDFEKLFDGIVGYKEKRAALTSSISNAQTALAELKKALEDNTKALSNTSTPKPKTPSSDSSKGEEKGKGKHKENQKKREAKDAAAWYKSNKDKNKKGVISLVSSKGSQTKAQDYYNFLMTRGSKVDTGDKNWGKIGKDGYLKQVERGKTFGKSEYQVAKDLANTSKLTWKEVLTAAKAAGRKGKTVKAWDKNAKADSAFRKAFESVYGKWSKFATGGLANYTGPAWLDGTPTKPELVLNSTDTKNFIALKDVLSKAIGSTNAVENTYGNATYEININVDHLNNDYDVDKVVERVKKKIVQDSSYRNVTQVRKFR